MRSKQFNLDHYDTDKVASGYLEYYDLIFESLVDQEIKLLEIGILEGGSLLLWCDYFPQGTIIGIDMKLPEDFKSGDRVHAFEGNQMDVQFLSKVANKVAPDGFDIIIDDASHIGELTKISFWHLFDRHLKPGGYYVIEDWGTGFWEDWPDGRRYKPKKNILSKAWIFLLTRVKNASKIPVKFQWHTHSYGMVGFIKELVDEQGAEDLTRGCLVNKPGRESKFESMLIVPSLIFIKKAA